MQQAAVLNLDSLDLEIDRMMQRHKKTPTGELADVLTAMFRASGFSTVTHPENERTAVIGVNPNHHAKVQAILNPSNLVYTRYNGKIYDINEPPVWDPSYKDGIMYKFCHREIS